MITLFNFKYHIMITLVLACLSNQLSLKNKREQDPSETDYFISLDESLRLDHLPVHDDVEYFDSDNDGSKFPLHDNTELEKIENDVNTTPDGEIVLSTVANTANGYVFNEVQSGPENQVTEAAEIYQRNDLSTYFYDYNDYHNNNPKHVDLSSNFHGEIKEENISEHNLLPEENQLLNLNETEETYDNEDYGFSNGNDTQYHEDSDLFSEIIEPETNTDVDEVESQVVETGHTTLSMASDDIDVDGEVVDIVNQDDNIDDLLLYIENPHKYQLLKSNKIAEDYESEVKAELKPSVWFKQMIVNDNIEEESHLSANCPDLNCEFGYKTDLFGKPICSCFNPCHEKKCGANICKIEKISDSKYIGACYDPSKIERPIHCHLPLATGRCKNYTSRFYFNSFLQRCSHFVYTGCDGNHNNFDTWEKCEMECNTCSLPAARGPCHGNIIRYYYDSLKRECVAFNWGGCKGNENNFKTRKHCEDSCIFRKEGALFLHGMPIRIIRKYHQDQSEEVQPNQN